MLRMPHDALGNSSRPARTRLRIAQVIPTYYPAVRYGGPIRSVHALSKALVDRGHSVTVFTSSMDGRHDLDVPRDEVVELDGVSVRYFPVAFLRRLCWCPSMQWALRAEAPDLDLIHLHSIFLWPTWMAARVAKAAQVPFLVSPRGMLGGTVIRRHNRLVKSAWIRLVEERTLREASAVHVTSDVEAEEIRALGLDHSPLFCVPNGVSVPKDPPALEKGPYAALPRPYALSLGRISWKKGLDRLLKAWTRVPDLHLVIAGNDEEHYLPKLKELAERERISARLHIIGPVKDEHKWALYDQATMFLLASYSENFANVVAEAMAMGCPVIVTPEVGLATMVRESGAGLVSSGEPEILARAINQLRTDELARIRCGHAGRRTVESHLSWSAVAAQMESQYEAAAGHGRASR